jgi:putative membrane protein
MEQLAARSGFACERRSKKRSSHMSQHIHLIACLATATVLGLTAASAQSVTPKATQTEQHFLTEAMQGDLAEVNVGKLAQEKGQAEDVRQFGQMLEQDHGDHLKQAEQMAQQLGVTAPNSPSAKQQAVHDKLEKLSGSAFDKEFKQAMVKDHQEDIAKYRKEPKGKGPLAQFAQQTVPTLEKHLKQAQALGRPAPTTGKGTNR